MTYHLLETWPTAAGSRISLGPSPIRSCSLPPPAMSSSSRKTPKTIRFKLPRICFITHRTVIYLITAHVQRLTRRHCRHDVCIDPLQHMEYVRVGWI